MGLRAQAIADAALFVAADGDTITITDPAGTSAIVKALTADIEQAIDPDTGQAIVGRTVSVAVPISVLTAASLGMPRGSGDTKEKPWTVSFDDSEGNAQTFAVFEARPDKTMGIVVCMLEVYKP